MIQTQTGEGDDERKGQKFYEKETSESMDFDKKKKNFKLRGRKDKYYE